MAGLFGGSKVQAPPTPKPVRMPTLQDPNAAKAKAQRLELIRRRRGRQSTIMTSDPSGDMVGSSGQSLGA